MTSTNQLNNNNINNNYNNNNRNNKNDEPFTMSLLHSKFTITSKEKISTILIERQRNLASLYFATRDKNLTDKFESGFRTTRINNDEIILRENDGELEQFLAKFSTLDKLSELDLTVPPLLLSPPPPTVASLSNSSVIALRNQDIQMKDDLDSLTKSILKEDMMMDTSEDKSSKIASTSKRPLDKIINSTLPPSLPTLTMASPQLLRSPSPPKMILSPASTAPILHYPPPPPPPTLPSSLAPVASTSSLPYIVNQIPLQGGAAAPALPFYPQFSIKEISTNYVTTLPELPLEIKRVRVNNIPIKRKGKEKVSPDLYKMDIKAQHTGAKNFLGKGKRVHNVLSTHEWSVATEEVRANIAFERIEQLKAEKAWTFRQPKKQRIGQVPKAHWDHLLDEMRWLHTDFRQETRWKITTAYNLIRSIKAWHKATPEQRTILCCKFSQPKLLPTESERLSLLSTPSSPVTLVNVSRPSTPARNVDTPLANGELEVGVGMDVDADADGEVDADADGEIEAELLVDVEGDVDADGEADDITTVAGSSNNVAVVPAAIKLELPGVNAVGSSATGNITPRTSTAAQEALQRAQLANQQLHKTFNLRAPIFELGVKDTVINPSSLAEGGLTLNELFPDLTLYSSFNIGDPQVDKRTEESSAWAGRLSLVSKLLESKPILVRTLHPSTIRTKDGWEVAAATMLEDVKEILEPREPPPATCPLFAGKKVAKENQVDLLSKPVSVPEPDTRAASLHWSPDEDLLVISLQKQFGTNWNLISDVFNGTTVRPSADNRLAWDMYDRWDKLIGPGSKKILPDGTEIKNPVPEYTPQSDKLGRGQFATFGGSKKSLRHLTVHDAIRKVQKKREATAQKIPPPTVQRRVNMSMHDSHNLPPRPFYSPMEWSHVKVEQDQHKMRNRQIQHQQEIALQRQQHQQQQLAQQQQQQNGGVRYQQAVPQGFPVQQGQPRLNSLPLNIAQQQQQQQQQQARNGLSPAGQSPGVLPNTSPRIVNQTPPTPGGSQITVPNGLGVQPGGNVTGAAALAAQFTAANAANMNPERMMAYQQQLQLQMQMRAESTAAAAAAAAATAAAASPGTGAGTGN